MSNRFQNPRPQYFDSTPAVYSGGLLYFYASGTSTPLATYSDSALSVPNANPVVLNSAGRPAVDIFLTDAAYKVILKDSSGNTIWTADPVSTSDYSATAQTLGYAGNPNGNVAGTAASGSIPADMIFDTTNNILYVATVTGTALTTTWTAINASTATSAFSEPQGYLTPTSATPIITGDVTAATSVYYTPYKGNLIPVYNGTSMVSTEFAELTLTLASQHSLNSIFDVFCFSNSGVVTLATGPAWTNITAGSCARGTGAGTTELVRVKGLWTNNVSMTGRNGSTTYTIAANRGTYLGSIYIDGTAGQITCHRTYGQSRKWGIWNAYNRVPIYLKAGDPGASWTYTTNTVRASNGSSANSLTIFTGLNSDMMRLELLQTISVLTTGIVARLGVGVNSTTAFSGTQATMRNDNASAVTSGVVARYFYFPALGINTITALEQGGGSTGTTFQGTESQMLLSAYWTG